MGPAEHDNLLNRRPCLGLLGHQGPHTLPRIVDQILAILRDLEVRVVRGSSSASHSMTAPR